MKKALTLSIIIPAYNEEDRIGACLDAIARQSIKPTEVILVNNNSFDSTVAIARQYGFVTVVHETKQGLIPARNKGFSIAKGDILARINTEAVLSENWVENVLRAFKQDNVAGLSGPASSYPWPGISRPRTRIYSYGYLFGLEALFGARLMWGANMAIRKVMWEKIKAEAHEEDTAVHEDQDLSMLVAGEGGYIKLLPGMLIQTDEQSYIHWPKLKEYWIRALRTKAYHEQKGTLRKKGARRLSFMQRLWRSILLPCHLLFVVVSFSRYYVRKTFKHTQTIM